jgi:hypothetical protein
MAFQLRDETAGIDIMYVNNANQMGLGSLPVNGQALGVNGSGFLSIDGDLGAGVMGPGSQAGYEGLLTPSGGNAVVTISTAQIPTVTSTVPPVSITTQTVVFSTAGGGITTNYSIW